MSRRLRQGIIVGLLALAATSLPYLPLLHGSTAEEVERLAAWLEVHPGMRIAADKALAIIVVAVELQDFGDT